MVKETQEIISEAAQGVHTTVVKLLKNEKRGLVLDAPSGIGMLSNKLKSMGFKPVCVDLDIGKFKFPQIEHKKVNLNEELSYEDGRFDYVVCVEGIEHIEDHFHLIREFNVFLRWVEN